MQIQVDEHVQLMQDIPELGLHRGEVGLVCSTWFSPGTAYEVEFRRNMPDCQIRALLMPNQITGDMAKHVLGSIVLDEQHLTEDQLLAKARESYANTAS